MPRFKTPTHELDQDVTVLAFNETQRVAVNATGGTFTLSFDGETSAAISATAVASAVQSAIENLSNISPGDITVTGGPGNSGATTPYFVTFVGAYEGINVPTLTAAAGSLTGGAATVTITVTQQGGPNPLAVQRGTGDADATNRTDPLDGLTPKQHRAANPSLYGD